MKSNDKEPLIDEVLADPGLDELRAATLDHGMAAVRSRRQWRQLRRATAVTLCVAGAAAILLVVLLESASPGKEKLFTGESLPTDSAPATKVVKVMHDKTESGDVERLTDDELLALFPERPVALIGLPGRQKLVFLDQLRAGSRP